MESRGKLMVSKTKLEATFNFFDFLSYLFQKEMRSFRKSNVPVGAWWPTLMDFCARHRKF